MPRVRNGEPAPERNRQVDEKGVASWAVAEALLTLHAAEDRQALAEAISSLTTALDADSAACAFLDDNSGMLVPFLCGGRPASGVVATKLPLEEGGLLAHVLETGDDLVLDDLRELMGEEAPELPVRRVILARLQWQDERLGVVLFFDQGGTSLELYPRLADHIALALVRLRAFDQRLRFGGIDPSRWLFDREWLVLRLEEEVERARRYRHELTLLLFAFDDLEEIAGSTGSQQTQVFLRKAAAVIRNQVRGPDVMAGFGASSIAVLMTETPKDNAFDVQFRIADRLSQMRLAVDGPTPALLLGIAGYPEDGDSAASLVESAEVSLSRYEGERRQRSA